MKASAKKDGAKSASRLFEPAKGEDTPLFIKLHLGIPLWADELASLDHFLKVSYVQGIRRKFKWHWNAGAEYLYVALIRALDLSDDEEKLLRLAKPKLGRKKKQKLAARIWALNSEGFNVPRIAAILEAQGEHLSKEAVASYLKTRRKQRHS
jgi:hypothetical protein